LQVEGESLCFKRQSDLWLDTSAFEQAFTPVRGITGEGTDTRQWQIAKEAASVYGAFAADQRLALQCAIDGKFGPHTQAAVLAFQLSRGLTPDEGVGVKTGAALGVQL
jgi:peptidoglycan hydrolase-like protein with peptidoglycan-binding domain